MEGSHSRRRRCWRWFAPAALHATTSPWLYAANAPGPHPRSIGGGEGRLNEVGRRRRSECGGGGRGLLLLVMGRVEEEGAIHLHACQVEVIIPAGAGACHQHPEAAGRECPFGGHGEGGHGIGTGGDGVGLVGVLVQRPPAGTSVHRAIQPPRLQPIIRIIGKVAVAEGVAGGREEAPCTQVNLPPRGGSSLV
eukprot:GAFH01004852.1.p1 GENE.GAFH01004852.1~~GAFH01004852.1.p1  ORF type:complete len:193 (+),score=20.07 GAFH01004852.1:66-644(+)